METEKVPAGRSRAISDLDPHKLRTWRTQVRMLSQVELANAAGLSRGEISHLETGRRQPLATTLRRLCVALECQPADLLTHSRLAPSHWDNAEDEHAATHEANGAEPDRRAEAPV